MADSAPRPSSEHDRSPRPADLPRPPVGRGNENLDLLRATFEADYPPLVQRLAVALRSHDQAVEALHDAYVRLGRAPATGEVLNPIAYLFRMAMNLAHNVRVRDARMTALSPEAQEAIRDDAPDPERVALGKIDLDKTLSPLAELPERRRAIFLARWRDDLSHDEIARTFNLHKRTVQKELMRAELFLHRQNIRSGKKQPPA